jgi:purine-cytosine permease-like protein
LLSYVSFNTSDAILSGAAMNALFHIPDTVGFVVAAVIAALLALYGYRWIHRVNRWLSLPLLIVMLALSVAAFTNAGLPADAWDLGAFDGSEFMTVFVIMAGFQLGWAPYVSDYSRYLPADVGIRASFWWTYLPSAISGIWVFMLGAVMSAAAPGSDPVTAYKLAAESFGGTVFGWVTLLALVVGLFAIMGINQYGGSLTMISILDSFRPTRPSRRLRVATILVMFVAIFTISHVVGVDQFNAFYANVLIFTAYLFIPWTAINLVDYFIVRRGRYVISEIFNPNGIYGRWGWRGNLAYLLGFAAMVPFMVTAPFTGPVAEAIGGVDLSIFIGLPVAGVLYLLFCRSLHLDRERAMVAEEGLLADHR